MPNFIAPKITDGKAEGVDLRRLRELSIRAQMDHAGLMLVSDLLREKQAEVFKAKKRVTDIEGIIVDPRSERPIDSPEGKHAVALVEKLEAQIAVLKAIHDSAQEEFRAAGQLLDRLVDRARSKGIPIADRRDI